MCVPWLHYSKDKPENHEFSLIQLLSKTLLLNESKRERMLRVERANRLSLKALVKQQQNSPCTYGTNAPFFHFQTVLTIIYRKCSKAVCVTLLEKKLFLLSSFSLFHLLCNLYCFIFISCFFTFPFSYNFPPTFSHLSQFLFSFVFSFFSPSSSVFYRRSSM